MITSEHYDEENGILTFTEVWDRGDPNLPYYVVDLPEYWPWGECAEGAD